MLRAIASKLGRRPTFALSVFSGLALIGLGIAVFLITIKAWGGGGFLLPASVLACLLVALGLGLIFRASWWLDRPG